MATENQIRANRENAQHSTGPTAEAGKAASSLNNFRHGLAGATFSVLPSENQDEFDALLCALKAEHKPSTITETLLVQKMAQHFWLSQRAQHLQDITMADDLPLKDQERQFALFLRYQTTNDRAFHRCLNDLLKLKAARRKQEIGFESQQQKAAQESRREAAEKRKEDEAARSQRAEDRKEELHKFAVLLAEAKVDHQVVLNLNEKTHAGLAPAAETHELEAKRAA